MPTVSVGRDRLLTALGKNSKTYTQEEFEDLCFSFGIELDDVTTEKEIIRKELHMEHSAVAATDDEEIIYKIEVPANRYDLLCLEGIVQALRIFLGVQKIPTYTLADITKESMLKMHVKPETSLIRPFIVCAVLRGLSFDEVSYKSFIDLQDKLHENICRRRTLVAIGTHDLDTLQGPFTYEALPPADINFVPLKQEKSFRADELMEFYRSDLKLKKFLHIIEKSPVFPVIYDHNRTLLSLPPIINGAHSAITLKTKNVFIECTATDMTKAKVVLNTMVTLFSSYCQRKFEVEPVEVICSDGKSSIYPDLSEYTIRVPLSYINGSVGISLKAEKVISLLNQMQLRAEQSAVAKGQCDINVSVPPIRSDILHPCDVTEDVAIAHGYSNIPTQSLSSIKPCSLNELSDLIRPEVLYKNILTQGLSSIKPCSLNELSDLIRLEVAINGFVETVNWILLSSSENSKLLRRTDEKTVVISNPRTSEFEVVRTSLMPGILKTVAHNKDQPKPLKIFEVGDVSHLDEKSDVGASNRRMLAALYCGANSGYEVIHALVDRIMEAMAVPFHPDGSDIGYHFDPSNKPEFLPGRQSSILCKGTHIGFFGIVHPEVLKNFGIPDPCSFVELDVEFFV